MTHRNVKMQGYICVLNINMYTVKGSSRWLRGAECSIEKR